MKKTEAEWGKIWDDTAGTPFEKSLELLRLYCEYDHESKTNGTIRRFLAFRWRSHNSDAIEQAIKVYYPSPVKINLDRTHEELYDRIFDEMKKAELKYKEGGDLDKILNVIQSKTGNWFTKRYTIEKRIQHTEDLMPVEDLEDDRLLYDTY